MLRGLLVAAVATLAGSRASRPPALPFVDSKACPFEGCSYRRWTALEPVNVYDTWRDGRRRMAGLAKGEQVTGITGLVITVRPGRIRMDRDLPEYDLKAGQQILTYTYRGEGFSAVWFRGRYYSEFDISFAKWPDGSGCGGAHCAATYLDLGDKIWWAKVRLKSGRIGWVRMNSARFDGIDLVGLLSSRAWEMRT